MYRDKTRREQEDLLMRTRLALRTMGEPDGSLFVFSFYPDVLTLKEVGDPLQLGEFFNLEKSGLKSKIVLAQGRQNTNYAIYLYACHPFFIQGYATMTNGENTAFVPIREYLMGRGNPGYMGLPRPIRYSRIRTKAVFSPFGRGSVALDKERMAGV